MSFNAKDMTQGGQIASMRIRMFSQIEPPRVSWRVFYL
ncbi:hypothetical protein PV0197_p2-53 (plasmid) [Escherichia coli]|nr:hypothetical protein PV0197_p2-53 [Escherichia coli]